MRRSKRNHSFRKNMAVTSSATSSERGSEDGASIFEQASFIADECDTETLLDAAELHHATAEVSYQIWPLDGQFSMVFRNVHNNLDIQIFCAY